MILFISIAPRELLTTWYIRSERPVYMFDHFLKRYMQKCFNQLLLFARYTARVLNQDIGFNEYSNTPRLYSQWFNSVIYWLINHGTHWARTGVTSFSRQFDFHDVIYHIRHCNVDNRRQAHRDCFNLNNRLNAFLNLKEIWTHLYDIWTHLQLLDVQTVRKNMRFSLNKSCGKFWQSVQDGGIVIDYEGFVHISNLFCVLESK